MREEKNCALFRQSEFLSIGKGNGYCDMDGSSTACQGDVEFCEKPDACPEAILARKESGNTPGSEFLDFPLGSPGQWIR